MDVSSHRNRAVDKNSTHFSPQGIAPHAQRRASASTTDRNAVAVAHPKTPTLTYPTKHSTTTSSSSSSLPLSRHSSQNNILHVNTSLAPKQLCLSCIEEVLSGSSSSSSSISSNDSGNDKLGGSGHSMVLTQAPLYPRIPLR